MKICECQRNEASWCCRYSGFCFNSFLVLWMLRKYKWSFPLTNFLKAHVNEYEHKTVAGFNNHIDIIVHCPHIETVVYRWWGWWVCSLHVRHLRRYVWLRWGSCSFFSPGRRPSFPSAFWWWFFTQWNFVIPTPEHPSSPRRSDHPPGLWATAVSSSRQRPGHLEL